MQVRVSIFCSHESTQVSRTLVSTENVKCIPNCCHFRFDIVFIKETTRFFLLLGMFLGWDIKKHRWTLTEMLRAAAIQVEFVNNGKPTGIHAFTYAGFVGVFEGMKNVRTFFRYKTNETFSFRSNSSLFR